MGAVASLVGMSSSGVEQNCILAFITSVACFHFYFYKMESLVAFYYLNEMHQLFKHVCVRLFSLAP